MCDIVDNTFVGGKQEASANAQRSALPSISADKRELADDFPTATHEAARIASVRQNLSGWRYLFPARRETFLPQIHLAGRFGSEGAFERVCARQRMLNGLDFKWTSDSARNKPLAPELEALLETVLSARIQWRCYHNVKSDLEELRNEVVCAAPIFVFGELLCNAFDAQALANQSGQISLTDPFLEGELGVGLIWSRFLAELHDGTLDFFSYVYPQQKTTVRLSFPPGALQISIS